MANPVTVEDLEARFRPLTAEEQSVAQALLSDAWAVLTTELPNLEANLAADPPTVSEAVVVFVVSAMVLRVLRNPNGVRQWSVDDYSETRDSAISAGALYATDEEVGLLQPVGSGLGAAFTITPTNAGPGFRTDIPVDLDWS